MKPIDFTKYPKVLPYVEKCIGQSYFKPFEYNPIDEETFINVVEGWITKFEKDIDVMVKNTNMVYELTNEETGYQGLSKDWKRIKEVFPRERRISEELIRQWWVEKLSACISHFYQAMMHDTHLECEGGATGCMITCHFRVHLIDSDYKRVKYNVVSDFNMSLHIENSLHTEIDLYE
jgi:hypothetical protein